MFQEVLIEPRVNFMNPIRFIRHFRLALSYFAIFLKITFSREGLGCREGRQLIWGKIRRVFLAAVPPVARALQKHYGLRGSCNQCGASCKILFQCPAWDDQSKLCTVYEDRPNVCRFFPMTPKDISDRNLVLKETPCGFSFGKPLPTELKSDRDNLKKRKFPV